MQTFQNVRIAIKNMNHIRVLSTEDIQCLPRVANTGYRNFNDCGFCCTKTFKCLSEFVQLSTQRP